MRKSIPGMAALLLCASMLRAQQIPRNSKQLIVVVTDGWDSLRGTLYGFEKQKGNWVRRFSNAIVVGKNGLGVGDGLFPVSIDGAPVKQEGDGKSPAGFFGIGTAFGYAPADEAAWIKYPYVCAVDTLVCVDDTRSVFYNTLSVKDSAHIDYNSFEYMHRRDTLYRWGLFVNHNAGKPVPGKGSCIFIHIWQSDHTGTTGCTAMRQADLLRILHWIDAKKHPLLVQFPKSEYAKLYTRYHLPFPLD
jgi:D-alanyl-D-alanine dipeptidase